MDSPSSPTNGIVSEKIKLFNNKSETEASAIKRTQPPTLPPKPSNIKALLEYDSITHTAPPPPPPPPPRPSVTKTQKQTNTKKLSAANLIAAQKGGSSTLKVMFGKVVGSVSGKFTC